MCKVAGQKYIEEIKKIREMLSEEEKDQQEEYSKFLTALEKLYEKYHSELNKIKEVREQEGKQLVDLLEKIIFQIQ